MGQRVIVEKKKTERKTSFKGSRRLGKFHCAVSSTMSELDESR